MKTILRLFLINLVSLWTTTNIITGLSYTGGIRTLFIAASAFMLINLLLVPVLKVVLLPLNLLTLGLFAWVSNVIALYVLTTAVPAFRLTTYIFPGVDYQGFILPAVELTPFWVAVVSSLLIGLFTHFLHWLTH